MAAAPISVIKFVFKDELKSADGETLMFGSILSIARLDIIECFSFDCSSSVADFSSNRYEDKFPRSSAVSEKSLARIGKSFLGN